MKFPKASKRPGIVLALQQTNPQLYYEAIASKFWCSEEYVRSIASEEKLTRKKPREAYRLHGALVYRSENGAKL